MRRLLRENRVKQKIQQGEVASVISGENTANMIEVLGNIGFDGAGTHCAPTEQFNVQISTEEIIIEKINNDEK